MTFQKIIGCLLVAAVCLSIAGCNRKPDDPPRYEISGTVTYDGKPVPAGKITFESADKRGPRGIAVIKDGRYKTLPDQGAVGGKHVVKIFGFDGVCPKGWAGSAFGTPIFPLYQTKIDLPSESSTHDFVVPVQ